MPMLTDALILTRREIRDSLRDWRITAPLVLLALVFPYVMEFASGTAMDMSSGKGGSWFSFSFVPFALLMVGFFPVAISLVIALESFVGERERNTLEPLLASPLSDASLYIGKLLAGLVLPLATSYAGMAVYLITLYLQTRIRVDPILLVEIGLITAAEAFVMVSGAVVISSHTTSTRAANLLASVIIIPMAFFVQGESLLIFFGYSGALIFVLDILIVIAVIFVRMGAATVNREAILTREMDNLNWRGILNRFRYHLIGREGFSLKRIYVRDLPHLVRTSGLPLAVTLVVAAGSIALGAYLAAQYPLPPQSIALSKVQPGFENNLSTAGSGLLPDFDVLSIFVHNVRTLLISSLLGLLSFGSGALFVMMAPLALISLFTAEVAQSGSNPVVFFGAFILPHGIIEIPAAILATTFALRLGAAVMAPPAEIAAGEHFLKALADWVKVFVFLVLPLLLAAAVVEALLTPRLVAFFYGG